MNPDPAPPYSGPAVNPAPPGGAGPSQFTIMNIVSDPAKDHIIWSLCCFVYYNPCCLGLAALIYSIKARDRKMVGDVEGARVFSTTALRLNLVSSCLAFLTLLVVMITLTIINKSNS